MVLFLDVETVANKDLDPALVEDILSRVKPDGRASDKDASIRQKQMKLASEFVFSPMTNRIVLIGIATSDGDYAAITGITEGELMYNFANQVNAWVAKSGDPIHTVVTFNGKSFDIPISTV